MINTSWRADVTSASARRTTHLETHLCPSLSSCLNLLLHLLRVHHLLNPDLDSLLHVRHHLQVWGEMRSGSTGVSGPRSSRGSLLPLLLQVTPTSPRLMLTSSSSAASWAAWAALSEPPVTASATPPPRFALPFSSPSRRRYLLRFGVRFHACV